MIEEHQYKRPKGQPWGLCAICGLGQAAHLNPGVPFKAKTRRYRCPDCVTRGKKLCRHKGKTITRNGQPPAQDTAVQRKQA